MVGSHGGVVLLVLLVLLVVRHWGVVRVLLLLRHDDYLTILEIFFSVCSNGETK